MIKSILKMLDIRQYEHAKYLLLIPIYLVIFWIEERVITTHYIVSYMPMDDRIPFISWFVIPYFLWYPLMIGAGTYLFFADPGVFKKFMLYIGIGLLIIVLIYALVPNGQNLRVKHFEKDNFFTDMVKWVYGRDTNTNVCPSIHVVSTLGAMFAFLECKKLHKWWFQTLNIVLAVLICLSTVFIKQHSILDVIIGVPLSVVYYFLFFKWVPNMGRRRTKKKLRAS